MWIKSDSISFLGPQVPQCWVHVAILALLPPFPQSAEEKDEDTEDKHADDATDRYSDDDGDGKFIAGIPIIVLQRTRAFQDGEMDGRHDFNLTVLQVRRVGYVMM
jgi:hypothetical protein